MQKIGSISDILNMMPKTKKIKNMDFDDRKLKWTDAIINSMTRNEKLVPSIIDGSRRKRIALGSGRTVQEVNQLLNQFQQMNQMIKKMNNKKGRINLPFGIK